MPVTPRSARHGARQRAIQQSHRDRQPSQYHGGRCGQCQAPSLILEVRQGRRAGCLDDLADRLGLGPVSDVGAVVVTYPVTVHRVRSRWSQVPAEQPDRAGVSSP